MEAEFKNKNNKKILIIALIMTLIVVIGGSFAFFMYSKVNSNQSVIAGDIYMKATTNEVVINSVKPMDINEGKINGEKYNFSVQGYNDSTKDIYYGIYLNYGEEIENKQRFDDSDIMIYLTETKDGVTKDVFGPGRLSDFNSNMIYAATIDSNIKKEDKINIDYELIVWLSDNVLISDTETSWEGKNIYTSEEYKNSYISLDVKVEGDFVEKNITDAKLEINAIKVISNTPYDLETSPVSDEDIKVTIFSSKELEKIILINAETSQEEELIPSDNKIEKVISNGSKYRYYGIFKDGKMSAIEEFTINFLEIPELIFNPEEVSVLAGEKVEFKVNAKVGDKIVDGTYTINSTDLEIATVDTNENRVTINGITGGTVALNVSFKPNNNKYKSIENYNYYVKVKYNGIAQNILDNIEKSECNPVKREDGILYLSGTNECVDFNYIWYSGKLWQVYLINQDSSLKMITVHGITSVRYGSQNNISFKNSWVYQWLNEDFKDTLYNYTDFIKTNVRWDTSIEENNIPSKPNGSSTEISDIGLINYYEYFMTKSGTELTPNDTFIHKGVTYFTLTPKSSTEIWGVQWQTGPKGYNPNGTSIQTRPVVVLKNEIETTSGDGSKNNPFTLKGDIATATENSKLNTRISGEYVNFDGEKYRIVGIENGHTKIVKENFIKDASGNGITKLLGTKYGEGQDNTYADYYLNNDWYNSISEEYRKMLVNGYYYLGSVDSETHKKSICENPSDTVTIKDCKKLERDSWIGKVGLPRVGEMFATTIVDIRENLNFWSITPQTALHPKKYEASGGSATAQLTDKFGMRPTLTLASTVYITSGLGTSNSPYEIKITEIESDSESKTGVASDVVKDTIGKTGGVIGVTNDSKIVENETSNIREYRYSGRSISNYVKYNNELWRIVGVFKDEKGEEHLKIVKNDVLSGIFPDTYTIGDVTYDIKGNSGDTQAIYSKVDEHSYGDWSNAGLMYFLNTESDENGIPGYLSKINSTYKNMIEDTKYYLGTISYTDRGEQYGLKDTIIQAYQNERDINSCVDNIGTSDFASGCHVWANNHATWTGKIGLLYPSDYGFTTLFAGKDSSWLKNANHSNSEWLISKVSSYNWYIAIFDDDAGIQHNWSHNTGGFSVRPTLYLKADVKITTLSRLVCKFF